MKKLLLLTTIFIFTKLIVSAQVGIKSDNSNPDPSSMLDVNSDSKGALLPRLTKEQRNAISNPATGLIVYQKDDTTGYWFYNGAVWTSMQDNLGSHTMTRNLQTGNNYISYNNQRTGIRVGDSGTVKIYGLMSCCNPNIYREQFKFEKDGSFIARGELGIGAIPMEGSGYRTSWHSFKGAFRSGYADKEWNDSATGFFSWAGGSNTTASGAYSLAFGYNSSTTSSYSIAFGSDNKVYGTGGFAAGGSNEVNRNYAVALGFKAKARNYTSVALGYELIAKGYAGTVVGIYNDSLLTSEDNISATTTPLFVVGNGTSNTARSNAMVVRKNGDVEVENLRVGGGNVISKQQSGTFLAGSNTTAKKTVTFNFPASFTTTPKIVATPRAQAGTDYPDAFMLTTRSISATQVTFNIIRIDAAVGWDQLLQIDWMAWQ